MDILIIAVLIGMAAAFFWCLALVAAVILGIPITGRKANARRLERAAVLRREAAEVEAERVMAVEAAVRRLEG